jgi:hypothetical protein
MLESAVFLAKLRRLPQYLLAQTRAIPGNENGEHRTSVRRKLTQVSGSSMRIDADVLPNWISGVIRSADEVGNA